MPRKHKLRVRRGLKSELDQILLEEGELGYTVDTREVWIGAGTENILCGRVLIGLMANRPLPGNSGRIFEASDINTTYLDTGTVWKTIGVSSLDSITDGSTYGRVRLSELNSGKVKSIYAVGGSIDISGEEIRVHFNDSAKHREIDDGGVNPDILWSSWKIETTKADKVLAATQNNIASLNTEGNLQDSGLKKDDAGAGTQDLWSANKITNEINAKASGLTWQEPALVFNMVGDEDKSGSPPTGQIFGDAHVVNNWGIGYTDGEIREWNGVIWTLIATLGAGTRVLIKSSNAAGSFIGQEKNIADYDGASWSFITPSDGWAILINGDSSTYEHNGYVFSENNWLQFTGAGQINAGIGIVKSGNTLDINLGTGIAELPTDEVGLDIQPNQGLKLTSLATDGQVAVDYDDATLGIVGTKLAIKNQGVGADQINSLAIGDGLVGGNGQPVSANIGLGLQIVANEILAKLNTAGGLLVDGLGLAVNVDGTGLVISNNTLQMDIIDGGVFTESLPTTWYSAWGDPNLYWAAGNNAAWGDGSFYNSEPTNYLIVAQNNWNIGFRPTKMRITYSDATISGIRVRDGEDGVIQILSGPISSGQSLNLTLTQDFWQLLIETSGLNVLYNIEFDAQPPTPTGGGGGE